MAYCSPPEVLNASKVRSARAVEKYNALRRAQETAEKEQAGAERIARKEAYLARRKFFGIPKVFPATPARSC